MNPLTIPARVTSEPHRFKVWLFSDGLKPQNRAEFRSELDPDGFSLWFGVCARAFLSKAVCGAPSVVVALWEVGGRHQITGYAAKGLVLAGAGILVIIAALQADPAKASGLDAAVKTLGRAPFGKTLLLLAAAGIAAFGAYSFVRARYGRM